ncbi:MAG: chorismate synthase [Candidatus Cloacimonetes bacterium 4572_65]|nr:MAG: chorismate synthase [Candidatus Cloacimonetes bacterium 4572_65]
MNSIGTIFKVDIFGESHGKCTGVIISGVPAGIRVDYKELDALLVRRKPGAKGTTKRIEADIPNFQSGILNDQTTGSPILVTFPNSNVNSTGYSTLKASPRANHSDFVATKKFFGFNDLNGGGHFSGRITVGLIVAGYLAQKVINTISVKAELIKVGGETNFSSLLDEVIAAKDSIGGEILCKVSNLPIGLGSPFFNSVESLLAHILFSIPGVKSLSFGNELDPSCARGSEFNDQIIDVNGRTGTNNSGGVVGGITNGNELVFSVKVKPTPSIGIAQKGYNFESGIIEESSITGRHDACFALRVPVIIEAVTSIVLADLYLQRLMEERANELRDNS